ncbi:MAG: gliding motility-associated C-terminal domain-containing protein [Bacteroidia bacterium]|nr:gliding motility-associated C-terminal domain-containing protein [Bacteroidia bacterium]
MKQTDNIEKLFRDSLENLEADANPRVWDNIQSHLSSGSGSNATSSGILGSLMSKVITGVVGTAAVITAVIMLTNTGENNGNPQPVTVSNQHEIPVKKDVPNSPSDHSTTNHSVNANTPVLNSNDHSSNSDINTGTESQPDVPTPEKISLTNDPTTEHSLHVNSVTPPKDNTSPKPELPENPAPDKLPELPLFKMGIEYNNQGFAPAVFTFSNKGTGEVISWDFGDNSEGVTDPNPSHPYEQPGEYLVTMTVRDANGNTHQQTKTIKVKKDPNAGEPVIPNSFTPNGDGINDEFRITDNVNIFSFSLVIQDKNGKTISQWSGFEGYWDGRNLKGEICPPGTYIYVLKYEDKFGEKRQKVGTITIPNQR